MTDKEFDLIKKILTIKGELDKYVILCQMPMAKARGLALKNNVL